MSKILSMRQLEDELTSPRFIEGLEKAISTSQSTSRETMFMLLHNIENGDIIPTKIYVGERNKVSFGFSYSTLARRFYDKTGKNAGVNWLDFHNFIDQEIKMCWTEGGYSTLSDEDLGSVYPLVHFHTHVSAEFNYASSGDFRFLNMLRTQSWLERGGDISPLMIIAPIKTFKKTNNKGSFMIIQENSTEILNDTEIEKAYRILFGTSYLLHSICPRGNGFRGELERYTVDYGSFDRKNQRLDLESLQNFRPVYID